MTKTRNNHFFHSHTHSLYRADQRIKTYSTCQSVNAKTLYDLIKLDYFILILKLRSEN